MMKVLILVPIREIIKGGALKNFRKTYLMKCVLVKSLFQSSAVGFVGRDNLTWYESFSG